MVILASYDDIFALSHKVILTRNTFLAYTLPPLVCQYLMAVLVQLEGTRLYRFALLHVLVWLAWRAMFVDMSGGSPKLAQMNPGFVTYLWASCMRAISWVLVREPLRRMEPSNKHDKTDSESIYTAFWNAWDLTFNSRGIGWNWSRGLIVPKPVFETDSRVIFVLLSAGRLALSGVGVIACGQGILMMFSDTSGLINGSSLFDHTLPPLLELLRAVFASFLAIWMVYSVIVWSYQLLAIVGIILFQQRPSQWPPLFDSPWLSTSLNDFWGRRWHQILRGVLVSLGVQPFGYMFGRLGGLLVAFLLSGILHDVELRSLGRGGNSVALVGFWVMNGVGVVLERAWKETTGRRVGGVWGRMWTFGWLLLWGVWVVDEWIKAGRFETLRLSATTVWST